MKALELADEIGWTVAEVESLLSKKFPGVKKTIPKHIYLALMCLADIKAGAEKLETAFSFGGTDMLGRKFRNTDLKVGDKVRICMTSLRKNSILAPDPRHEGRIATILEVDHGYSEADYDCDCYLDFGDTDRDWIDTQYLEAVTV